MPKALTELLDLRTRLAPIAVMQYKQVHIAPRYSLTVSNELSAAYYRV